MRQITKNQVSIINYLKQHGTANYMDLEPLIETDHMDIFKATIYCIAELKRDGIITMSSGVPATYTLSKYGKELL